MVRIWLFFSDNKHISNSQVTKFLFRRKILLVHLFFLGKEKRGNVISLFFCLLVWFDFLNNVSQLLHRTFTLSEFMETFYLKIVEPDSFRTEPDSFKF